MSLTMPIIAQKKFAQLRQIFPEVFCGHDIDFDKLKLALGKDSPNDAEHYGLSWAGKTNAYRQLQSPTNQTLLPCPSESVDFDNTQNLFIEGDNLIALKLLQKSYHNRIKMIYIDPPYNTGKDFIYNDNFKNKKTYQAPITDTKESSGLFKNNDKGHCHSNWLNMMLPRLYLAKNLLSDDGVIFISIDDNEQAQLKLLCDEVFGNENFVADFIWHNKYTVSNDTDVSYQHEHIMCFCKNRSVFKLKLLPRTQKQNSSYKNTDNDPKGDWKPTPIHARSGSSSKAYEIKFPNGVKWSAPVGRYPRYSKKTLMQLYHQGALYFNKKGGVDRKTYLSTVRRGITCGTLWHYDDVGHSHGNNEELAKMIGKGVFNDPKGTKLLSRIIDLGTDSDSLILDFFAGSATTAHAVMQSNAKDGGNRRFICVQLPEATNKKSQAHQAGFATITEISKERIRRAGAKIKADNPNKKIDTGFRVFKMVNSHFKQCQDSAQDVPKQPKIGAENIADNVNDDGVVYELLLQLGLKLSAEIKQDKGVYWLTDKEKNKNYVLVLRATAQETLTNLIKQKPNKIIALDKVFASSAIKSELALQCQDEQIEFETL